MKVSGGGGGGSSSSSGGGGGGGGGRRRRKRGGGGEEEEEVEIIHAFRYILTIFHTFSAFSHCLVDLFLTLLSFVLHADCSTTNIDLSKSVSETADDGIECYSVEDDFSVNDRNNIPSATQTMEPGSRSGNRRKKLMLELHCVRSYIVFPIG